MKCRTLLALPILLVGAAGGYVAAQTVAPPSDNERLCVLEDLMNVANPWCDASSTTTTSTPATTTTRPSTTTSTSSPPQSTTTSTVPTASAFFEDFTGDTIGDFTARFDWSVVDLDRSGRAAGGGTPWQGQHNMACMGPDTERTLTHAPISNTDPGVEFWLCGPAGPSSDHLMTSNGSDGTFGITAFSPKPSFTGSRVCWDVNLTESPGARRWWEVQILPAAAVANEKALADGGGRGEGMVGGVDFERGTAFLGWGQGVDGTFMKRPIPPDGLIFDFTVETVGVFQGKTAIVPRDFNNRYVTQDRATRAHHCWVDNGNGTMTVTQQRPGRADYVKTFPGSFPKPFRVIFADDNYNSGKDGSLSNQTWHWDNIEVGS